MIGALIFLVLALVTSPSFFKALRKLEEAISKSSQYLLFGAIGTIIGLLLGVLGSFPLYSIDIPFISNVLLHLF